MSEYITNDYQLTKAAEAIAQDTFDRFKADELTEDDCNDDLWESCDQSQHVIYTYRAKLIAGNCDCSDGEDWLEGIYSKPFDGCDTFDEVCTRLAFAELYVRAESALRDLMDNDNAEEEQ